MARILGGDSHRPRHGDGGAEWLRADGAYPRPEMGERGRMMDCKCMRVDERFWIVDDKCVPPMHRT